MHELSLMENVRDLALEEAHRQGAHRIASITLRIGSLAGVEPEALRFAHSVVWQDTIAAGASLRIEEVAAACWCRPCGDAFPAEAGICECPRCGAISAELLQGRELQLVSMEIS